MVRRGWAEEVRRLVDSGVTPGHSCMASVGYRELAACLTGNVALEEAIRNIKTGTHRFARHQYAWFRLSDPRIRWMEATDDVGARAAELVEEFLAETG